MKKILWLLFLIPIFITKVYASEIYYSEYGNFSPFQEEFIEKNDIVNVLEEKRYLWYKNNKIMGDYILYNETDNFDLEDCYETEFSNWNNTKPIDDVSRIYEERISYQHYLAKGVRYIHLYDLQGSYSSFRIPELMVYANGEEISYTYTCEGCWDNFGEYIHNGITAENKSYIDNGGSLIIDLGKEYPINSIDVIFYIFDIGITEKTYTIGYSLEKNYIYYSKSYALQFTDYYWKDAVKITHNVEEMDETNEYWTDFVVKDRLLDDEYVIDVKEIKQYRYKEKYCKYYTLEKEYNDTYTKESIDEYVYKDETKFKIFYSYQKRDKLEINIYDIIEKDFDLNKFVIFSTDDYQIINDINWDKNGEYNVKFILNDMNVDKKVKLNLKENTIIEYENKIIELEEQLKIVNNEYKEKEELYNSKIKELEEKITKLTNDLIECKNNCEINKQCLENLIKEKEQLILEYEENIINLSNKINELQIELNDKIEKINSLNIINNNQNEKIKNLKDELIKLEKESKELNEILIINYDKKINSLNNLNDIYIERINDLENELKVFNDKLAQIIKEKEILQNNLDEQININNNLEKENNNISLKLNGKTKQNEELNNQLNNYLLKINRFETNNLFWVYILILLSIVLLINKLRKRSK